MRTPEVKDVLRPARAVLALAGAFAIVSCEGGERALAWEEGWERIAEFSTVVEGDSAAPVTIIEFTDMRCPPCSRFHTHATDLVSRSADVKLVVVQFPVNQEPATLAAVAATECAAQIGLAKPWMDALFSGQDSVGVRSWGAYAADAGIADTAAIAACAASPVPERVRRGMALGHEMNVGGTPTVLVNGWRFRLTPSASELESVVTDVRAGREPALVRQPAAY